MLGIGQLAIYVARPEAYLTAIYVEWINTHFTIIGVVFATVWIAEDRWADARGMNLEESAGPSLLANPPRPSEQHKPKKIFVRGNISLPRSLFSDSCCNSRPGGFEHSRNAGTERVLDKV